MLQLNILGVVEGFGFPDNSLKTAIGQRDGNAYEKLYEWSTKYNDFNKVDWSKDWEQNVKSLRGIKPKL